MIWFGFNAPQCLGLLVASLVVLYSVLWFPIHLRLLPCSVCLEIILMLGTKVWLVSNRFVVAQPGLSHFFNILPVRVSSSAQSGLSSQMGWDSHHEILPTPANWYTNKPQPAERAQLGIFSPRSHFSSRHPGLWRGQLDTRTGKIFNKCEWRGRGPGNWSLSRLKRGAGPRLETEWQVTILTPGW